MGIRGGTLFLTLGMAVFFMVIGAPSAFASTHMACPDFELRQDGREQGILGQPWSNTPPAQYCGRGWQSELQQKTHLSEWFLGLDDFCTQAVQLQKGREADAGVMKCLVTDLRGDILEKEGSQAFATFAAFVHVLDARYAAYFVEHKENPVEIPDKPKAPLPPACKALPGEGEDDKNISLSEAIVSEGVVDEAHWKAFCEHVTQVWTDGGITPLLNARQIGVDYWWAEQVLQYTRVDVGRAQELVKYNESKLNNLRRALFAATKPAQQAEIQAQIYEIERRTPTLELALQNARQREADAIKSLDSARTGFLQAQQKLASGEKLFP